MTLCRHCHAKPVSRSRGLCWSCYYTPAVRDLYPACDDRCEKCQRRLRPDIRRTGTLCGNCAAQDQRTGNHGHGRGTHLAPATEERIAELQKLAEDGQPLTPDRRERDEPRRINGAGPRYHGGER